MPRGGARAHLQHDLERESPVDGLLPPEVLHHCDHKVARQPVAVLLAACAARRCWDACNILDSRGSRQTHRSMSVQRQIAHARPLQTLSGCTGAAHLQRWLPGRGRLGSCSQVICRTPLKGTQARVRAPARQAAGAPRTLHARAVVAVVQRHGRQLDLLRHGHLVLRRARLPEAAAPAAARSLPQAHPGTCAAHQAAPCATHATAAEGAALPAQRRLAPAGQARAQLQESRSYLGARRRGQRLLEPQPLDPALARSSRQEPCCRRKVLFRHAPAWPAPPRSAAA